MYADFGHSSYGFASHRLDAWLVESIDGRDPGGHHEHDDRSNERPRRSESAGGPVFIAGGTGKTGRRVAERLEALGIPVRIGSRSSSHSFDWEHPEGWAAALQGASAIYATYAPDLAVPGAVARHRAVDRDGEDRRDRADRAPFRPGRSRSAGSGSEWCRRRDSIGRSSAVPGSCRTSARTI